MPAPTPVPLTEEPQFLDLSESQKRQYIDAETVFSATLAARKAASEVRGGMVWKTVGKTRYLIRTSTRGAQKSLGPESEQTQQIYKNFSEKKDRLTARLKSLETELTQQQRLLRALRVGRVPNVVVGVLNQFEKVGIGQHFLVIGTHALYAYESAAGVRIYEKAMATRDMDLLFDTRNRVAFQVTVEQTNASLISIIQRVDPSFEMVDMERCTLRNAKGFEIDIVRRMAGTQDEHSRRMTPDEDDIWPVQISQGERLLSSRRFEQMVVSLSGEVAMMRTVHPLDFVRTKTQLGTSLHRDPLKAGKDLLQAQIVTRLVDELLPQFG